MALMKSSWSDASVMTQIYSVLTTRAVSGIVSFILLKIIDMVIGLRVTSEIEQEGLDLALHGEAVQ